LFILHAALFVWSLTVRFSFLYNLPSFLSTSIVDLCMLHFTFQSPSLMQLGLFLDMFSNNTQIPNFMKICQVGAESFHAHRQTWRS